MAQEETRGNLYSINLLTAVFIFLIVFFHHISYTRNYFQILWDYRLIYLFSQFAVGGFFFLSGYKITKTKINDSAASFLKNRFIRIYPLYFIAVILYVMLVHTEPDYRNFLLHIFMIQDVFRYLWGISYTTIYFVNILFFCYLFFLLLRKSLRRINRFIILALVAYIILAMAHLYQPFRFTFLRESFFIYFTLFAFGMLVSFYESKIKASRFFNKTYLIVISLYSLAALWFFFNFDFKLGVTPEWSLFLNTSLNFFAFAPLCLLIVFHQFKAVFWEKCIDKIAYSSLAVFLFHRPIWEAMRYFWPEKGFYQWLYIFPLGILIIFVFSYIVQRGYDRFVRNRIK